MGIMYNTLFLSGGGNEEESYKLDSEFIKRINGKVLYIPVAINKLKHPYPNCLKWFRKTMAQFGINDIEMWTDLKSRTQKDLDKFSAVYIGGGNTYDLMATIRKTGFDKLLTVFLKNTGVVYGGSAGAIIFGKDIDTSKYSDKNNVNIKNKKGLNLVKGYSIWCHYQSKDDSKIKELIKEKGLSIIAIPECSGIIVNQNIKVIGEMPVYLFKDLFKTDLAPESVL